MNNNDEKVKEILETEEVPEELQPENIKTMLDEKAPKKKRSGISVFGRITAVAASCAIIAGTAVGTAKVTKVISRNMHDAKSGSSDSSKAIIPDDGETSVEGKAPFMCGAQSYEEVYQLMKRYTPSTDITGDYIESGIFKDDMNILQGVGSADNSYAGNAAYDVPEEAWEEDEFFNQPMYPAAVDEEGGYDDGEEGNSFYETYNQEEGVLEADIVKTDGKRIYYINNETAYFDDKLTTGENSYERVPSIRIADVKDGEFTGSQTIDITPNITASGDGWMIEVRVEDMYLYNDMIAVIGNTYSYRDSYTLYGEDRYDKGYFYEDDRNCFVSFYTTDDVPELIGTYVQDGGFKDVRITPEGYMYLITTYTSCDYDLIDGVDDIEEYIPKCGVDDNACCMPPEDILLPGKPLDNVYNLSYTVIGSLDLTESGTFSEADTKALAGYTGNVYCSAENLYTTVGYSDTDITRISIAGGAIEPQASGKVDGYVLDQFSMSEYDGYFRIAVTADSWTSRGSYDGDEFYEEDVWLGYDNRVYVLDMEMNIVGSVEGFGKDETIKSVNFSGDMGYVVTYEQTDPLFAIDLSDPTEPFITDEFKILGYSTYMQKWSDGLLLGFGIDADEYGIEDGIKLTMFDNSDPYDLQAVGTYVIANDDRRYVSSEATYERKALMIAPEKNIIGVPISAYEYYYSELYNDEIGAQVSKFMFFSYDDGEFTLIGELGNTYYENVGYSSDNDAAYFDRAVYIGDYVYILSGNKFVSADIETITQVDVLKF